MKQAFTMIELIFVIVIIGVLSAIAVPKFAATRDDALIVKGRETLASVRSAIAAEKQKRILRGDFTAITDLSAGGGSYVFDKFSADKTGNNNPVLEYPPKSCTTPGCWEGNGTTYTFHGPSGDCTYTLSNNRLTTAGCSMLGD